MESSEIDQGYEALFSYGYLRTHYLASDISSGKLLVNRFIRPESLQLLSNELLKDSHLLTRNNTTLQFKLSPLSRQCLWELHSGIMIRILENITKISNLLPDPHCTESMLYPHPSAKFKLHNWVNPDTNLEAGLVLIINLGNGDAHFCSTALALQQISIDAPSLQLTYWRNNQTAGEM